MDLDNSGSYRSLEILVCHWWVQLQQERNPNTLAQARNDGALRRYADRPLGSVDRCDIERVNVGSCHEIGRELHRRVGDIPVWGAGVPIVDGSEPGFGEHVVRPQSPSRARDLRDSFLVGQTVDVQSYRTEADSLAMPHQLGGVDQVEVQSHRRRRRARDRPQRGGQRSKCAP